MGKQYKHIPTGKIIGFAGCGGESMQRVLSNSMTMRDLIKGEDWEEIGERLWEITGFKRGEKISTRENMIYEDWIDSQLDETGKIYSVKRLSDDVEFKIGDKYILRYNKGAVVSPIKNFVNCSDDIIIYTEHGDMIYFDCWTNISINEKVLTTEDGVDVYEGNKIFALSSVDTPVYTISVPNKKEYLNPLNKYFSTEESAKEYSIMNTPLLTLQEIKERCWPHLYALNYETLKVLANQKYENEKQPHKG